MFGWKRQDVINGGGEGVKEKVAKEEERQSTFMMIGISNNKKNNKNNNKRNNNNKNGDGFVIAPDSIYEFYIHQILPAIGASLPILFHQIWTDVTGLFVQFTNTVINFLTPQQHEQQQQGGMSFFSTTRPQVALLAMEQQALQSTTAMREFLLRHFDTNRDGHISPNELINMTDIFLAIGGGGSGGTFYPQDLTGTWQWLVNVAAHWPISSLLMDWKLAFRLLWRSTLGRIIILIALLSILPGRFHAMIASLFRWPILAFTYAVIGLELIVYIIIRIFIKIIETVFGYAKHKALRRKMRESNTYQEWYSHAQQLDISQGRHEWQESSSLSPDANYSNNHRINWSFIRQLIMDLRTSRQSGDTIMALAVLQQCTRKNVGGIMTEESFSFTNTGEPKHIVKEFIQEAEATLQWVTDECCKKETKHKNRIDDNDDEDTTLSSSSSSSTDSTRRKKKELLLKQQSTREKQKLYQSLLAWATLQFPSQTPDIKATSTAKESPKKSHNDDEDKRKDPDTPKQKNGKQVVSKQVLFQSLSSCSDNGTRQKQQCDRFQVMAYLKRARAAYGRTALCLSGGAMMGCYHFGHIKALLDQGLLPQIISGTSAGAIVGATVCTRTDEEIRQDIDPEMLESKLTCFTLPWSERIKNIYNKGCMFHKSEWMDLIQWMTMGDMTFEEAYQKTGRVLCITLSSTTKKASPVLLNYISAPNVLIASAVIASAAVPGFIEPVRLEVKGSDGTISYQGDGELYWDGSIEQDIPTTGLAEMLNCQFFIVAQCNPHIVPFFFNSRGGVGRPTRWSSGSRQDAWRGGFLLSALELYLKNDMKSKFQFLSDIEAAVSFTANLMTQQFVGTTTIVPDVSFWDYFRLFTNPTKAHLVRYLQSGMIAAFKHTAMIRLHLHIADALDECLEKLLAVEGNTTTPTTIKQRRRRRRRLKNDNQETMNGGATLSSRRENDAHVMPSSSEESFHFAESSRVDSERAHSFEEIDSFFVSGKSRGARE